MKEAQTIRECEKIVRKHGGKKLIVYGHGIYWEWLIDMPNSCFVNTDKPEESKLEAARAAADWAKRHLKEME